eukprot:454536-Pelagomonas_calceolata.AAC.1
MGMKFANKFIGALVVKSKLFELIKKHTKDLSFHFLKSWIFMCGWHSPAGRAAKLPGRIYLTLQPCTDWATYMCVVDKLEGG